MNKSFKLLSILFLSIFLSVSVGAIALAVFYWCGTIAHLSLENESGIAIERCIVEVSEKRTEFRNMAPGSKRDFWFFANKDDAYHVTVDFKQGLTLGANLGYVTSNLGNRDRLLIFADHIKLKCEERLFGFMLKTKTQK